MEMLDHGIFEIFRIKIQAQAGTFFSLRIFLYFINIHMVHEKEKCTPLRLNISRAVNVGAELNVYGILVNEGTSTMSFVLHTINVEYMIDVSHVS